MSRRAFVALLAASVVAVWAQSAAGAVSVQTSRMHIATRLGDKFTLRTTVVNHGSTPAKGLIAHLNIVGLDPSIYVDPEDWSSHRTRYLATIPPGASTAIDWRLQAVSAGKVDVYAAVLQSGATSRPPATSPAVRVAIADKRTLNSGGILPLALGVPALLGALAVGVRIRRGAA